MTGPLYLLALVVVLAVFAAFAVRQARRRDHAAQETNRDSGGDACLSSETVGGVHDKRGAYADPNRADSVDYDGSEVVDDGGGWGDSGDGGGGNGGGGD